MALIHLLLAASTISSLQGIESYSPPSLEQILGWYAPLPSLEEVIAPVVERPDDPWLRTLDGSDADQVRAAEARFLELADRGEFGDALREASAALEIRRRRQGNQHPQVVELGAVVQWLTRVASLPQGEQTRVTEARALDRRVSELESRGELQEAVRTLREALRIRAETSGVDAWDYAYTLYDLAYFAGDCGENELADRCYRECLDRRARLFGREHPQLALSLSNFGNFLDARGEYESSERLTLLALRIRRASEGPKSPAIPNLLASLAVGRTRSADIVTAETLFRKAVADARACNPDTLAGIVGNAGFFFKMTGNFAEAELLLRESVALYRSRFGDAHPETAYRRQELACVLQDVGRFEAAEEEYRAALVALERSLGPEHRLSILTRLNLATLLAGAGDGDDARALLSDPEFESRLNRTGDVRNRIARLQTLGAIALDQNRVQDAVAAFRAARGIASESSAPRGSNAGMALVGLAVALDELGSPEALVEASQCAEEAVTLLESLSSPLLYEAHVAFARILQKLPSRAGEAEKHLRAAAELYETLSLRVGGDELDQAAYRSRHASGEAYASLSHLKLDQAGGRGDAEQSTCREEAFDFVERGRARALLNLIERGVRELGTFDSQRKGGSGESLVTALREHETALLKAQGRLRTAQAELQTESDGRKREEIASRVKAATDAERQALRDRVSRLEQQFGASGADAWSSSRIQHGLRPSELLLLYQLTEKRSDLFALRPGGHVTHHRLSWADGREITATDLGDAIAGMLSRVSGGSSDACARAAALRKSIIPEALASDLAAAKTVFVVPDRPLLGFPFELLYCGDPRSAEAIPTFAYGPSATVLMKLRAPRAAGPVANPNPAVLVGDPLFRIDSKATSAPSPPDHGALVASIGRESEAATSGIRPGDVILSYGTARIGVAGDLASAVKAKASANANEPGGIAVNLWREGAVHTVTVRPGTLGLTMSPLTMPEGLAVQRELTASPEQRMEQLRFGSLRDGFGVLTPLPGARAEVAAISDRLQKAGWSRPVVLVGADATIANLAARVAQPRFLHLATHGAICSGSRVWESALAMAPVGPRDAGFLRLLDLLDSWQGRLRGTEMVVLSGCETAAGQTSGGDGLIGLSWGFFYAGAQTVVASHWKVDDRATLLLMDRFYENITGTQSDSRSGASPGSALPKAAALREAKEWLRRQSPAENRAAIARLSGDLKPPSAPRDIETARRPSADPVSASDPFDFSHPRFWAAFVLIGNPD